ncbi:hypothetical protein ROZALSC1DRAFT_26778 [Rozella allomycis CSF55]|uniref:SCP domain-containing protein n=1 Tax=Rozella allomycis (strain CSF55) TaxID=988480 RepID=A0A075AVG5_ROZAC|nr:hypothetical protein O9G_002311 [Rozella allomycis CSF55]RKP21846.1 hypothetical protein ROZALSC1DRAFT_26778 [Rozella allomycis CSF55]|eukprot:EPZ32534.1 hypothetical protein O9G_002311 [Rozella allomycis CSF55]
MKSFTLLAFLISNAFSQQYTTFQGDIQTTYLERTIHTLTNAVRIDPKSYLNNFSNAGTGNCLYNGSPARHLFWNMALTQSGRFHCTSMQRSPGCWQHDTCPSECYKFGSCSWSSRIWSFYKKPAWIAENIYAGPISPVEIMDGWIRSKMGHCENLLAASATELGVANSNNCVIQDFGGASNTDYNSALVIGSHVSPKLTSLNTNNLLFLVTYVNDAPPSKIWIQIGQQARGLSLLYGSSNRGVYYFKLNDGNLLGNQSCQNYFFRVIDTKGRNYRFPEKGRFLTFGINGCNQNYNASI